MAFRAARRAGATHLSPGLLLATMAVLTVAVSPAAAQSTRPTIVIDPGHPSEVSSGLDVQNGTSETHVAWQVAQQLSSVLRAMGYRVVLTKSREKQIVTNIERAAFGNRDTAALV